MKLTIPYGIKIEKEYILGFGKNEVKYFVVGVLITIFLAVLTFAITNNPLITIIVLVLGGVTSVWVSRKDTNQSQSGVEIVKSIINFHKNQQTYKYGYRHWWEKEDG